MNNTDKHRWRFGFEVEFLIRHGAEVVFATLLRLIESGLLQKEPFVQMIETTVGPSSDPEALETELRKRLATIMHELRKEGVQVSDFASYASRFPNIRLSIFGQVDPYTKWLLGEKGEENQLLLSRLCVAGVHLNMSNGFTDDEYISAVNALRAYAWMFIALTANSPFINGKYSPGVLSTRMLNMQNYYPCKWHDFADYLNWLLEEQTAGLIHASRTHYPMTVCLRGDKNGRRIELRTIDSGSFHKFRGLPAGCCKLASKIVQEVDPSKLPTVEEMRQNDMEVARLGRHATIVIQGEKHSAKKLLAEYCKDIPDLMERVKNGSPAELEVIRYHKRDSTWTARLAGH